MKNKLIPFLIISMSVWSMDTPSSGAGAGAGAAVASITFSQPLEKISSEMGEELERHFISLNIRAISPHIDKKFESRRFFSDVRTILSIYFHELGKLKLIKKFNEFEAQGFLKDIYDEIETIKRKVNFLEFQKNVLNRTDRFCFEGLYEEIYAKAKKTIISFVEKIKLLNIGVHVEDSEPSINADRVELERYSAILHEVIERFIDSSLSVTAYNVEQVDFFSNLENPEETRARLFCLQEELDKIETMKNLKEKYSDKEILEEYKKIFFDIESKMQNYKCEFIASSINHDSDDENKKLKSKELSFDETFSELLKLPESSSELFADLDSIQKIKSKEFIQKQESFLKNSITLKNFEVNEAIKAQNIIIEIRKLLAKLRHASTNNHTVIQTKIEKIIDLMILKFPLIIKPVYDHDASDPQVVSDSSLSQVHSHKVPKETAVYINESLPSTSGAAADLLDSSEATFGGAAADTLGDEIVDLDTLEGNIQSSLIEYEKYLDLLSTIIFEHEDSNQTYIDVFIVSQERLNRLKFFTFEQIYEDKSLLTKLEDNIRFLKEIFRI